MRTRLKDKIPGMGEARQFLSGKDAFTEVVKVGLARWKVIIPAIDLGLEDKIEILRVETEMWRQTRPRTGLPIRPEC